RCSRPSQVPLAAATAVVIRSVVTIGRSALAVVMLWAVLFGSAEATAASAPRDALQQALRDVHALARPATAAASALGRATVAGLWIDALEADAPPYGRNAFTASAQAVEALAGVS